MVSLGMAQDGKKALAAYAGVLAAVFAGAATPPVVFPGLYRPDPYTSTAANVHQAQMREWVKAEIKIAVSEVRDQIRTELRAEHVGWSPHVHTHSRSGLSGPERPGLLRPQSGHMDMSAPGHANSFFVDLPVLGLSLEDLGINRVLPIDYGGVNHEKVIPNTDAVFE